MPGNAGIPLTLGGVVVYGIEGIKGCAGIGVADGWVRAIGVFGIEMLCPFGWGL
jgi:hypothetical protein